MIASTSPALYQPGFVRPGPRPKTFGFSVCVALFMSACGTTTWQAWFYRTPDAVPVDERRDFLKCHLKQGGVVVLTGWKIEVEQKRVVGQGIHYNASRAVVGEGAQVVALSDVVLFETNRPNQIIQENIVLVGMLATVTVGLGAYCAANPKACFGSCPTFYAHDGNTETLQAEGFSHSVARALEATDVDALYTAKPENGRLQLRMTNEALETHFVDRVRVLAVVRPPGARVVRSGEQFFPVHDPRPPTLCKSMGGDCREALSLMDGREYSSLTDGSDLTSPESVELTFTRPPGALGLVVGGRNSLLNTFLFYQTLAFMGRTAGDLFAELERSQGRGVEAWRRVGQLLGDVGVQVLTERGWVHAGSFYEVGPIAREVQVIALPEDLVPGHVQVRLDMVRGNWRLDQVALVGMGAPLAPVPVPIEAVRRNGALDRVAWQKLTGLGDPLVTYPGDAYTLEFILPAGDLELFLESRGYYYEWMREEWLADEDATQLARLLTQPEDALRDLAPAYKRVEAEMDAVFWGSRFGKNP